MFGFISLSFNACYVCYLAIKESQQQLLTQLAETTTATTATHNRLQANQAQPCRDNSPLRRSRFKLKFNVARRRRLRRCLLHISSLAFDVVINILSGYSNSNCYCCSCCCRRVCQLLFRNLVICCVCMKRYTHTHLRTLAHTLRSDVLTLLAFVATLATHVSS